MATKLPFDKRRGYYAYEPKAGGILWMDRISHEAIKRRPHTIGLYQCAGYTGQSRLMTESEWKAFRYEWSHQRTVEQRRV